MPDPIITLTTDFGVASPYVAAMKGVILGINPEARIVDLTHQVPPQDVRYANQFLAAAIPYFPAGVIHVVVVDPGVGTDRHLLHVEAGGHRLLLPDNGCWTQLVASAKRRPIVRRLAEPRYWNRSVSDTFHGRDILAPIAAHLSLGVDATLLGPVVTKWRRLRDPRPKRRKFNLSGEVVFVDHFGNLITNISELMLADWADRHLAFNVGSHVTLRRVRTYGEAAPGQLVTLIGSTGKLEFAVVQGNAARELKAGAGTPVMVNASH